MTRICPPRWCLAAAERRTVRTWSFGTAPKHEAQDQERSTRHEPSTKDEAARNWLAAWAALAAICLGAACSRAPAPTPADLLLFNARVYTLVWPDPAPDGTPSPQAPFANKAWHPDAEAVAIVGSTIVFVGSRRDGERYRSDRTRTIDLNGAIVVPGLVDSHVHIAELGAILDQVNLVGIGTETEAVEKVAQRARSVPKGEWIVGWGWDEGAWANHYPDMRLLSERVPDHPVYLRGLHSFAVWGNRMAFERAGITARTKAPAGGEIRRDAKGNPTGILVNSARSLLENAVPAVKPDQLRARIGAGLNAMAAGGFVSVHQAGADTALMKALEGLEAEGKLPLRVYAMLAARDEPLLQSWLAKGPDTDTDSMLRTRSVKAFYDGALGSRGARLLEDYTDRPGHRGVSGQNYGFNRELVASMMRGGFQVAIHAIGDAGNRETLDFFESVIAAEPRAATLRHRIEHAQVINPDDFLRLPKSGIIASMEPPHAVEDKAWAEDRLGSERVKGAYAWRTLRRIRARLVFNSDLPGSDHDIFYGLHSAITRRGNDLQPAGGWHPEQRMTPEEALRGYTTWAAYAAFVENETGVLAPGRWADITVTDIDPLVVGSTTPEKLFDGKIRMTIVGGKVVYDANNSPGSTF